MFIDTGRVGVRRPRRLLAGCLAVLAVAASACGGDDDPVGGRGEGEQRTVRHALGTTQVPAEPRRLVIADPETITLGYVTSLGLTPVAAMTDEPAGEAPFPGLERTTQQIDSLGGPEVDLEAFLQVRPDLILMDAGTVDPGLYDELSRIAPTVAVEYSYRAFEDLRLIADVLGVPDAAEDIERRVDEAIDRARSEIGDCGTVTITGVRDDGSLRLYDPDFYFHTIAAQRLGCELVPTLADVGAEEDPFGISEVSAELTGAFTGEVLFLAQNLDESGEQTQLEMLRSMPLFQRLPAVQAGRVAVINNADLYGAGIDGWLRTLDTLTQALRDPSTK